MSSVRVTLRATAAARGLPRRSCTSTRRGQHLPRGARRAVDREAAHDKVERLGRRIDCLRRDARIGWVITQDDGASPEQALSLDGRRNTHNSGCHLVL